MIRLRGHHLLCLHGFRGLGYSPEFVSNMWDIHGRLKASPETQVEVVCSPDDICALCPHLLNSCCVRRSKESESRTAAKDLEVLSRLGLSPGNTLPAMELFALVVGEFSEKLEETCSSCRWFSLGWCAEGLRNQAMMPQNACRHI